MKVAKLPFNISLMKVDSSITRQLKPITTTDITGQSNQPTFSKDDLEKKFSWQGSQRLAKDFNEDGLFSTTIFGRVGDKGRDKNFSYINIKVKVFHPLIHKAIVNLKGLYGEIMQGKTYAVFDEKERDFIKSNEVDGSTGFDFFVKHWENISFRKTDSPKRTQKIKMIEKYKDRAMTDKILVMPAGLRDVQVVSGGRMEFDEINDLYRRVIGISRTIASGDEKVNSPALNYSRMQLQNLFNDIYDYITTMLEKKKGLVQNKWASRRIFHGTSNVISAMDSSKKYLGGRGAAKATDTIMGLYQLMMGCQPLAIHLIRSGFLSEVFNLDQPDTQAKLVDPKTYKADLVDVPPIVKDRWTTIDGVQKVLKSFGDEKHRHDYIKIEGRYLGLIYKGPDMTFRIFSDIDELPDHLDKKHVEPISLVEFLYLAGYKRWNKLKCTVTRYPVAGLGSTYPSNIYVKTSVVGESRYELDANWEIIGDDHLALEFPTRDPKAFVNSLSVSTTRLSRLGGDFDGDTCSANILFSDNAINEIDKTLSSREAYIDPAGGFRLDTNVDTVKLVLNNMTG